MNPNSRMESWLKMMVSGALILTCAAGLLLTTVSAFAGDPTAMAPPIPTDVAVSNGSAAGADTVFNWQEIPANQQVPLTSAAFDQGGYQLYDTVGETIIVPFTEQNLYVMKFARSGNGTLYFENQGNVPVLYVPRHGYLSNASVSGARWYPFGKGFHPTEPVYLGIAPSWSLFVGMGWYPTMYCYGGYWNENAFMMGSVFQPSAGLFFNIGGRSYYGWNGYRSYAQFHQPPYHMAYSHRDLYRWAGRPRAPLKPFAGANHPIYAHRTFSNGRGIVGERTNVFRGSMGESQGGFHHGQGGAGNHPFSGGHGARANSGAGMGRGGSNVGHVSGQGGLEHK